MSKQLSINILQGLILLISVLFLFAIKISASSVDTTYKFLLQLRENEPSTANLIVNIKGENNLEIVDKYSITIPVKNAENFIVDVNGESQSNLKVTDENEFKTLTVTFNKPIPVKDGKNINIQFTSPELLVNQYGLKHVFIQNPFENRNKPISYQINYPKSFGNYYRTYEKQSITEQSDGNLLMEIESMNGIYILLGDEVGVNLKLNVKVKNDSNESNKFYFNLPSPTSNQKVYFNNLNGFDNAFNDDFNNLLGEINLNSKEEKTILYDADVHINNISSTANYPEKYNFNFNALSSFGKEILENTNNLKDNYSKMRMFNQILINKAKPNKQSSINYSDFDNIWKKLETNSTINSFEYAALNISFAEYLGLNGILDYGYIFTSPIEMDLSRPQVWAVVNIDGKNVFIDSFLEDLSTISYFDINYVDRVNFGTWSPIQTYNPASGLAYQSNAIKVEIDSLTQENYKEGIEINFNYPESIPSGNNYSIDLNIKNNSSDKTLQITDLREDNIFSNESKKFVSEVKFASIEDTFSDSDDVSFYIDSRNILIFVVSFTLSISILGFIALKVKKVINSKR